MPNTVDDGPLRPRLLLVEDDPQLGPLMAGVLDEYYETELVADGGLALDRGLAGDWAAMVIDRRLPGIDGLTLVDQLRARRVVCPILMLTALGTVRDRVDGLDAGANDYLVKPFEFDELLARLRALRRVFSGEGRRVEVGSWDFYPESRVIYSPYDGRILLTQRETDLLRLLAESPGRTFTRMQILSAVFEASDLAGSVDTYVHYLRRKTDIDIVQTVRGQGYRLGTL